MQVQAGKGWGGEGLLARATTVGGANPEAAQASTETSLFLFLIFSRFVFSAQFCCQKMCKKIVQKFPSFFKARASTKPQGWNS